MNRVSKGVFAAATLAAGFLCAEDARISSISARQDWPWSGKVCIDFAVAGTNCDVKLTASFDGTAVFALDERHLSGDLFNVAPGLHHVEWDPVAAGYGGRTLTNFKVAAEPVDPNGRLYMIVELDTGGVSYTNAAPTNGWIASDNQFYKKKMVFRRIPAGTFTMGYSDEMLTAISLPTTSMDNHRFLAHAVTISSDYYMSVYELTQGQYNVVTAAVAGVSLGTTYDSQLARGISYAILRGASGDGIHWPDTEGDPYRVSPGSFLDKMRTILADKLPSDWVIDLPTSAQWERAAKADTPTDTYWATGGTAADNYETLSNCLAQVAANSNFGGIDSASVGTRKPNGWGLYDTSGCRWEWVLDYYKSYRPDPVDETDPVGPATGGEYATRQRRGGATDTSVIGQLSNVFFGQNGENFSQGVRLCIHMKRIEK